MMKSKDIYIIHHRLKVWGHPDNLVFSMKTHFYLSNELQNELKKLARLEITIFI